MAGVGLFDAAALFCAGVGFGGIDGDGVSADGCGYVGASVGWRVGFAVGEKCG
jgi:hypothetical protein